MDDAGIVVVRRGRQRPRRNRLLWLVGLLATAEAILQSMDATLDARWDKTALWRQERF